MTGLNQDEKELLVSFERDEWQSITDAEAEFQRYREYARITTRKDKRVFVFLGRT